MQPSGNVCNRYVFFSFQVRKILIETKVLLASRAEKTQWNITSAVQEWQNNASRNLGLTIIVTDEKNRKLPAHSIFGLFDCSNATSKTYFLVNNLLKKKCKQRK